MRSHPAWVCGLKLSVRGKTGIDGESHPAWVCGLKLTILNHCLTRWSHTLRGCVDWNSKDNPDCQLCQVTPCVGVWIETSKHIQDVEQLLVTPCVGVWIETFGMKIGIMQPLSHPAWVCGLKHMGVYQKKQKNSHTLRGCVDWNNDEVNTCIDNHSHTLRGCIWIEALFTRWSSLWKNCKHSASCVFLFKLL